MTLFRLGHLATHLVFELFCHVFSCLIFQSDDLNAVRDRVNDGESSERVFEPMFVSDCPGSYEIDCDITPWHEVDFHSGNLPCSTRMFLDI